MRFAFTDDQRLFGAAVGELLEKECTPEYVRALSAGRQRSPELWQALARQGVVGVLAPEDRGGLGLSTVELMLPLEAAGRAALPEPLAEVAGVAIPLLTGHALLPEIVAGRCFVGVGVDPSGQVLDADVADLILVADGEAIHTVARGSFEIASLPSVDGARRASTVRWEPRDATRVADDPSILADARSRGALGTAAVLLGVTDRLLEMTSAYAKERSQFGKPIGTFQAVKHHLADAMVRLAFARPVVYRAADSVARSLPERARDASMAKALASEAATFAARIALQVHGAIGYTQESDLHLWLKRAWSLSSAWGDARWHRSRVGGAVL
jgi:alkylation response protein AidB-like acyl-CoA dehydrogenase